MEDNHSFTFIYCANHENECEESSKYLDLLNIPAGYTITKKILQGNFSIAQGYNFAMRNSSAKYKIYLHKKLNIVNRNFLIEILSLFNNHPELGMLGVLGAKKMPPNGNWRDSTVRCGKVIFLEKPLIFGEEITNEFESVRSMDGMIMITQYDLPWREDLFENQYFYDSAQCMEFIKAGYTVGIPRQHEPWCSYNNSSDDIFLFFRERDVFLQNYQKFIR
jgi:hypothetical protein